MSARRSVYTHVPHKNIHHNFPRIHWQVCVVERPVELLLSLGLVGRVVVRVQIWICQRLASLDAFPRIEDKHTFEQFDCCACQPAFFDSENPSLSSPCGSAFLNLFLSGCRSRLGSDCTKRRVYGIAVNYRAISPLHGLRLHSRCRWC